MKRQEKPTGALATAADWMVLGLGFLTLVVLAVRTLSSPDLWWQLAAGKWILEHGFPTTDPFSYWASGRTWIELRWLWCVAIRGVFDFLGPAWLTLGTAAALAGAAAVVVRAAGRGLSWAGSAGLFFLLALAHTRFVVRPEIVTYLALVAELAVLYHWRAGRNGRWLAVLPVLQVVWVNAHTLFVLGPVVAWAFVLAEWTGGTVLRGLFRETHVEPRALRAPLLVAVAMTVACLVNPWGLNGALFPLQLFSEIGAGHSLKNSIQEFRSPWTLGWTNPFAVVWLLGIAACGAALLANRRRAAPSDWALCACFVYLSSLAIRNVALLGFAGGFLVARNLGDVARLARGPLSIPTAWVVRVVAAAAFVVAIPAVASGRYYERTEPGTSFGLGVSRIFPVRALAFARANGLPMPVIHSLGDGGYVLFEGGPGSVLVDGRLEVYGGELLERSGSLWSRGQGIDEVAAKYGAHTALVRHGKEAGFLGGLLIRADWVPVYVNPTHVLFVHRTDATRGLVDRLAVDWRAPVPPSAPEIPSWYPGDDVPKDALEEAALGRLFLVTGGFDAARKSFERAVAIDPSCETANLHLGLILRSADEDSAASTCLRRVRRSVLERSDVLRLEGTILERSGHPDRAVNAYRRAMARGDESVGIWRDLARAALAAGRGQDARAALEEIARRDPSSPENWRNLGILLQREGDADGALRCFERSVALDARQPAVFNQIGVLRIARGDQVGAKEAFRRALAADPSYVPARSNLERL